MQRFQLGTWQGQGTGRVLESLNLQDSRNQLGIGSLCLSLQGRKNQLGIELPRLNLRGSRSQRGKYFAWRCKTPRGKSSRHCMDHHKWKMYAPWYPIRSDRLHTAPHRLPF